MPLSDGVSLSDSQALNSMAPSMDHRNAIDTDRFTKAIYVAVTADGVAGMVKNEITGVSTVWVTGGTYILARTKTAATFAGCMIVYLY